jgi:hypothetical protein
MKLRLIALVIFFAAQTAYAQATVHQRALQALRLYETTIAAIDFMCNKRLLPPDRSQNQDLICKKNRLVPSVIFERTALPYFQEAITEEEAAEVIKIFTSEPMHGITKKLVQFERDRDSSKFSEEEDAILAWHNETALGRKLNAFAGDRLKSIATMRAIIEYQPSP